jgi:hypothetical protein
MSNTHDDGGPAFAAGYHPEGNSADHPGMFLRDYFAAAALQGALASDSTWHADYVADYAYKCADAMLAARKAKR